MAPPFYPSTRVYADDVPIYILQNYNKVINSPKLEYSNIFMKFLTRQVTRSWNDTHLTL